MFGVHVMGHLEPGRPGRERSGNRRSDRLGGLPDGRFPECRSVVRSAVDRVSAMFRRPRRDWSIDPPAGAGNRPALPISELDPTAWNALEARAAELPVEHVHDVLDFMALTHEEFRAALRMGRALNVDDDQLFSLALRHREAVHDKLRAELGRLDALRRPATGSRIQPRRMRWRIWKFRVLMRGTRYSGR
jgi:hypothetical protein